jgi:hypothetical protein
VKRAAENGCGSSGTWVPRRSPGCPWGSNDRLATARRAGSRLGSVNRDALRRSCGAGGGVPGSRRPARPTIVGPAGLFCRMLLLLGGLVAALRVIDRSRKLHHIPLACGGEAPLSPSALGHEQNDRGKREDEYADTDAYPDVGVAAVRGGLRGCRGRRTRAGPRLPRAGNEHRKGWRCEQSGGNDT